jgi:peroxiredoxin
VVAISSDSFDSCRDLRKRIDLPYGVYSDFGCKAIQELGIFHDDEPKSRQIARPTIYILGPEREILYRYVGTGSRDRPNTSDIPAIIRSLS